MKTETSPNGTNTTTDETKRITEDELAYLRVRLSALDIAVQALQSAQAEYQKRMVDKDGFITYMGVKYGVENPQITIATGEIVSGDGDPV